MKTRPDAPRRRRASLLLSFAVPALLAGAPAHAQDKAAEVDRIFSWATPQTPGCACAVSLNGKVLASRAYGLADLERGTAITPETIFDVGSVVKQFVAASTLLLVQDGRLSLTEDIRRYVPELPDYGHRITLDHLMTHTGGIRDWTGILPLAAVKEDALTLTLRQKGLNFAPGEEWSYSNSGYVLLKEIVARTSGMSFADFTRKRLFEPLGMKSTTYRLDLREVVKDRALAYEKEGDRWKMDVRVDNERGGGGALFSTAGDLLIWNDALTSGRLGKWVTEKLQEPAKLNNGRKLAYARGLFLETNVHGRLVWHTGSAGAYKTLLARYPDHGFSVAVLCNAGESSERGLAVRSLFELFMPDDARAASAAPATPAGDARISIPEADLMRMEGLFLDDRGGEPLRLLVQNGRLRIAGGPGLAPLAKDRFRSTESRLTFMSGDELEVRVVSPDELELKSMEGRTTRYRRSPAEAPAPADLEAFAGRYESREIGTVFRIEALGSGLVARLEHAPERALELRPIDRDVFQLSRMTLRFQRDRTGKVVALDYSNPIARHIPFTRLTEQAEGR